MLGARDEESFLSDLTLDVDSLGLLHGRKRVVVGLQTAYNSLYSRYFLRCVFALVEVLNVLRLHDSGAVSSGCTEYEGIAEGSYFASFQATVVECEVHLVRVVSASADACQNTVETGEVSVEF